MEKPSRLVWRMIRLRVYATLSPVSAGEKRRERGGKRRVASSLTHSLLHTLSLSHTHTQARKQADESNIFVRIDSRDAIRREKRLVA